MWRVCVLYVQLLLYFCAAVHALYCLLLLLMAADIYLFGVLNCILQAGRYKNNVQVPRQ